MLVTFTFLGIVLIAVLLVLVFLTGIYIDITKPMQNYGKQIIKWYVQETKHAMNGKK